MTRFALGVVVGLVLPAALDAAGLSPQLAERTRNALAGWGLRTDAETPLAGWRMTLGRAGVAGPKLEDATALLRAAGPARAEVLQRLFAGAYERKDKDASRLLQELNDAARGASR